MIYGNDLLDEIMEPGERLAICRDPADDKFFECALAAGAGFIVTEDRDILHLGEYRGVKTVTAEAFLALLESA